MNPIRSTESRRAELRVGAHVVASTRKLHECRLCKGGLIVVAFALLLSGASARSGVPSGSSSTTSTGPTTSSGGGPGSGTGSTGGGFKYGKTVRQ